MKFAVVQRASSVVLSTLFQHECHVVLPVVGHCSCPQPATSYSYTLERSTFVRAVSVQSPAPQVAEYDENASIYSIQAPEF